MEISYGTYNVGTFGEARTVTLENANGLKVTLCALGAGIMSIFVPDRDGTPRNIVKANPKGYGNGHNGLTVGRTSGRIQNAEFTIDGRTARLEKNNFGVDNLHGGKDSLSYKIFDTACEVSREYTDAVFTYFSPNGEGGYFGNATVTVTYRVYEHRNAMEIIYRAVPDCKTLFNFTNHSYFNVSGDMRSPAAEQIMFINASRVGVLDERMIMRSIAPVSEAFDFRSPHAVGDHAAEPEVQKNAHGYDHPFFLDNRDGKALACSLYSVLSGIKMEVRTSYPVAVVYACGGACPDSVCFECQYDGDGIHNSPDDCGVCSPEKPYCETISYSFSIEKIS